MGHITILEGPDGGGKSTLAEVIFDHYQKQIGINGVNTVHHGPYPEARNIAPYYSDAVRKANLLTNHLISDRCWLSEEPYGEAFRDGRNRLQAYQRRMLERLYLTYQTVVVKCMPPFEKCVESFAKRKGIEYLESAEQLRVVYDEYDRLRPQTLTTIKYDYTKMTQWRLLELLEEIRPLKNEGPGAGSWLPELSILIVGDQTNLTQNLEFSHVPFFNPRFNLAGCSAWFAEQLEEAETPEWKLYWINSENQHGKQTNHKFIDQLQPQLIIALGDNAANWCQKAGVAYQHCPHPQWWKRFNHKKPYPIIKILQDHKG